MWIWIIVIAVIGFAAYVRLAPANVQEIHKPVEAQEDRDGAGHAVRVLPAEEGLLERLDAAMRADASVTHLAGSVEDGHVSYVARSKWWGFPDYITIEETQGQIRLYSRLRFGRSDLGVNAARLKRLIATAQR